MAQQADDHDVSLLSYSQSEAVCARPLYLHDLSRYFCAVHPIGESKTIFLLKINPAVVGDLRRATASVLGESPCGANLDKRPRTAALLQQLYTSDVHPWRDFVDAALRDATFVYKSRYPMPGLYDFLLQRQKRLLADKRVEDSGSGGSASKEANKPHAVSSQQQRQQPPPTATTKHPQQRVRHAYGELPPPWHPKHHDWAEYALDDDMIGDFTLLNKEIVAYKRLSAAWLETRRHQVEQVASAVADDEHPDPRTSGENTLMHYLFAQLYGVDLCPNTGVTRGIILGNHSDLQVDGRGLPIKARGREHESAGRSISTAIRFASQISLALSQTHACGIAHLDVKPDNILDVSKRYILTLDKCFHSEGATREATGGLAPALDPSSADVPLDSHYESRVCKLIDFDVAAFVAPIGIMKVNHFDTSVVSNSHPGVIKAYANKSVLTCHRYISRFYGFGTDHFIAPERLIGDDNAFNAHAYDIFSLGVTIGSYMINASPARGAYLFGCPPEHAEWRQHADQMAFIGESQYPMSWRLTRNSSPNWISSSHAARDKFDGEEEEDGNSGNESACAVLLPDRTNLAEIWDSPMLYCRKCAANSGWNRFLDTLANANERNATVPLMDVRNGRQVKGAVVPTTDRAKMARRSKLILDDLTHTSGGATFIDRGNWMATKRFIDLNQNVANHWRPGASSRFHDDSSPDVELLESASYGGLGALKDAAGTRRAATDDAFYGSPVGGGGPRPRAPALAPLCPSCNGYRRGPLRLWEAVVLMDALMQAPPTLVAKFRDEYRPGAPAAAPSSPYQDVTSDQIVSAMHDKIMTQSSHFDAMECRLPIPSFVSELVRILSDIVGACTPESHRFGADYGSFRWVEWFGLSSMDDILVACHGPLERWWIQVCAFMADVETRREGHSSSADDEDESPLDIVSATELFFYRVTLGVFRVSDMVRHCTGYLATTRPDAATVLFKNATSIVADSSDLMYYDTSAPRCGAEVPGEYSPERSLVDERMRAQADARALSTGLGYFAIHRLGFFECVSITDNSRVLFPDEGMISRCNGQAHVSPPQVAPATAESHSALRQATFLLQEEIVFRFWKFARSLPDSVQLRVLGKATGNVYSRVLDQSSLQPGVLYGLELFKSLWYHEFNAFWVNYLAKEYAKDAEACKSSGGDTTKPEHVHRVSASVYQLVVNFSFVIVSCLVHASQLFMSEASNEMEMISFLFHQFMVQTATAQFDDAVHKRGKHCHLALSELSFFRTAYLGKTKRDRQLPGKRDDLKSPKFWLRGQSEQVSDARMRQPRRLFRGEYSSSSSSLSRGATPPAPTTKAAAITRLVFRDDSGASGTEAEVRVPSHRNETIVVHFQESMEELLRQTPSAVMERSEEEEEREARRRSKSSSSAEQPTDDGWIGPQRARAVFLEQLLVGEQEEPTAEVSTQPSGVEAKRPAETRDREVAAVKAALAASEEHSQPAGVVASTKSLDVVARCVVSEVNDGDAAASARPLHDDEVFDPKVSETRLRAEMVMALKRRGDVRVAPSSSSSALSAVDVIALRATLSADAYGTQDEYDETTDAEESSYEGQSSFSSDDSHDRSDDSYNSIDDGDDEDSNSGSGNMSSNKFQVTLEEMRPQLFKRLGEPYFGAKNMLDIAISQHCRGSYPLPRLLMWYEGLSAYMPLNEAQLSLMRRLINQWYCVSIDPSIEYSSITLFLVMAFCSATTRIANEDAATPSAAGANKRRRRRSLQQRQATAGEASPSAVTDAPTDDVDFETWTSTVIRRVLADGAPVHPVRAVGELDDETHAPRIMERLQMETVPEFMKLVRAMIEQLY